MRVLRKREVEVIYLAINDGKPETSIMRDLVEKGAGLFKLYCLFKFLEIPRL